MSFLNYITLYIYILNNKYSYCYHYFSYFNKHNLHNSKSIDQPYPGGYTVVAEPMTTLCLIRVIKYF